MVTVQELIDELQRVKDKSKYVGLFIDFSKNSAMLTKVGELCGKVILSNV